MTRSVEVTRTTRGALTGDEAQELFAAVDETGHTNEETARRQHSMRKEQGQSVAVDPLAGEDPSGANTDRLISLTALIFVSGFLIVIVLLQVGWGYVRRVTTSTLAEDASMHSVVAALNMGVEWGGGFTQFPSEFTVHEADERTHRVEVTVIDSSSSSEMDAFATAQVQASALSVNALLNPNINTVTYHVRVRTDEEGHFQKAQLFGFLRPTGAATPFMTFVWTKTVTDEGVRFDCAITGMDAQTQERLHDAITSKSTPATIINYMVGDSRARRTERLVAVVQDKDALAQSISDMIDAAEQAVAQEQAQTQAQTEAQVQELAQEQADAQTTEQVAEDAN